MSSTTTTTTTSAPSSPLATMSPKFSSNGPPAATAPASQAVAAAQAALNGTSNNTNSASSAASPSSHTSSTFSTTSGTTSSAATQYLHTKTAYDNHPSRSNWATTSHVIEHLQGTIDSLRRELNEQNARVTEERQGREALRKRCEKTESQLERLKHENETFSSIISRKERRVKQLEQDIEDRIHKVSELETHQTEYIKTKNEYDTVMKRVNEDKERAEIAYKAVVQGSQSVKAAYEAKFADINKLINQLTSEHHADQGRIAQLQGIVEEQRKSREHMASIQTQMKQEREQHLVQLTKLVEGFQAQLAHNEQDTDRKVEETLKLVSELKKTQEYVAAAP